MLHDRIAERFRTRFATALPQEVHGLLAAGVPLSAPAFSAIGYRDTAAFVAGDAPRGGVEGADPEGHAPVREDGRRRGSGGSPDSSPSPRPSRPRRFRGAPRAPASFLSSGRELIHDRDAASRPSTSRTGFSTSCGRTTRVVEVTLISGRTRVGRIRRFDKYARRRRGRRARGDDLQARDRVGRLDRHQRSVLRRLRRSGLPRFDPPARVRPGGRPRARPPGARRRRRLRDPRGSSSARRRSPPARRRQRREGRLRDALDGFREAVRLAPADPRYAAREKTERRSSSRSAPPKPTRPSERKDVPAARRAAVSILEVDPKAAAGYRALAKAAEAEGALEDAWSAAKKAHEIDGSDTPP